MFRFAFIGLLLLLQFVGGHPYLLTSLMQWRNGMGSLTWKNNTSDASLNMAFQPTRNSPYFHTQSATKDRKRTEKKNFLNFGTSSKVIKMCGDAHRSPCNKTIVTRNTCIRWQCCWKDKDSIPCAKAVFHGPLLGNFLTRILEGRIIGGTTALQGEWPWIAYLYELQNGPVLGGFCGGTLISDKWVVTAAHCIGTNDPSLYGVILGALQISNPTQIEVNSTVSRIVIHPLFDTISFNFDIALIELSKPVQFSNFISPVCVVPPGTRTDSDQNPTYAGSVCSTLGWGFTSSPGGSRSDTLMQLNLIITPETICRIATLESATDYSNRPVFQGNPKFCAGGQLNEDTCDGDSGGPLLCLEEDGSYYLHGLTSYGTNTCGQAGKPGVYTKIANPSIRNFINETAFI